MKQAATYDDILFQANVMSFNQILYINLIKKKLQVISLYPVETWNIGLEC